MSATPKIQIDANLAYHLYQIGVIDYNGNLLNRPNVGDSNYSEHFIMPWHIQRSYNLDSFDADIIKRVLRKKSTQDRYEEYQKIIQVCQEQCRQLECNNCSYDKYTNRITDVEYEDCTTKS